MKTADELRSELGRAEAELAAAAPTDSGDPALARLGGAALKQHHRATDSRLRRYTEAAARVAALRGQLNAAENREAEANRPRLTAADLAAATHVQDRFGWHRVVRVNARTVTVETPYSWTDRIPVGSIVNCHPAPAARAALVHRCPEGGEAKTSCCGLTLGQLPMTDRTTIVPALVTCNG